MSGGALGGSGPVVFVSYSREDGEWRRRFIEMLKPLVRERRLEVWSDDRVVVGYAWRPQLAKAISRSRVALLLISPAFLASDFIMEQELPTSEIVSHRLERGRHTNWHAVTDGPSAVQSSPPTR